MEYSIKVSNLVKKYGSFIAVDGISFEVKKGEIFGFLGPNGAGKTTTVHTLTTIIEKTSGDAFVAGYDVSKYKEQVRDRIGIVFQDPSLDDRLTGYENLDFHAMVYGLAKGEREERISELLDMVELKDKANLLISKYSGGMRRRLEIARGLLNRPEVLFLDEPTIGLDVQTRRHILDYVKSLKEKYNMTVLITTHYIEEADYICDRVAIIDKGKIVVCDTPKNLKKGLEGDVIIAKLHNKDNAMKLANKINKEHIAKSTKISNNILYTYVKDASSILPKFMNIASKEGISIENIEMRNPSLEDVFIHYTGKSIRDEEGSGNESMREIVMRRMR